ncbi:MAG TPA: YdcF family protein [Pirellulales bacterium]|nr:YdcF family protein [Pirellulales bacterium]
MYRLLNELLRPYTLLLIVVAFSAVWAWRRRASRWAPRVLLAAVAGLLLPSIPAVSDLGFASLEAQTVPLTVLPADTAAMVVLSGGILPPTAKQPRALPGEDTLYRCLSAAELYRGKPCLVVVSGGTVAPEDGAPPVAEVMREFLVRLGVNSDDLLVEDRSTTTYENAVESRRVLERLGRRRIVLVTDALHMPRAAACFRHVGLEVTEAPCRFITGKSDWSPGRFLPSSGAARGSERVMHEWLGVVWYWLQGRM